MEKQIYIFGDSITYGAIDREGGWALRLRKWFDGRMIASNLEEFYLVYNLGISGDTSSTLLARFETEMQARLHDMHGLVIVFAIGINDSQYLGHKDNPKVSLDVYKRNITTLYERAAALRAQIVFVGLTNVDESKTMPVSWNKNSWFDNENIRMYDDALNTFCKKNHVPYIELQGLIGPNDLADGLHPTTEGHGKIFEKVKTFVEKMLV